MSHWLKTTLLGAGFIFKLWGIIPVWIGATIRKIIASTPAADPLNLQFARIDDFLFIGPHYYAQMGRKIGRKISKI